MTVTERITQPTTQPTIDDLQAIDPERANVAAGTTVPSVVSSPRRASVAPVPVGTVARRTRTVERRDIELFTALCGDRNPVHYDPVLAGASRFGEVIVQGGVTTALLNAIVAEQLPGPGSVFLETTWSYRAPVRPGDAITAEVEVLSARADKPITRLRTTITDQDGRTVLDGEATVWRDPVVAAATGWSAGLGELD